MAMLTRKQVIGVILLMVFALIKAIALWSWKREQSQTSAFIQINCHVHRGCEFPSGELIQFNGLIFTMGMGFNRYQFTKQNEKRWIAIKIFLPICTFNRVDYLADVRIGKNLSNRFSSPIIKLNNVLSL